MGAVLPLLALRAFSEIGRLGSIKAAANSLGVTPGAVSQQLRLLEDRLGVALFVRTRHGLHLTEAGARAHPGLLRGFDQIEASLSQLHAFSAPRTLTLSTVPSFASAWLVPRLGRFNRRHPGIEVRVEASATPVDFSRERTDVALRHGLGSYPGLHSVFLMAPVLLPVASPALLANGPAVHAPQDCLSYPLLQDGERADWRLWLQAHGVDVDDTAQRGASFDEDLMLLRAATAGQGIALVQDKHAQDDIDSGRLCVVVDKPWPTRFAYYAVCRPQTLVRPEVQAFLEWLQEEAAS